MAVTFPRFLLATFPTPLTRAHRLERALGAALVFWRTGGVAAALQRGDSE